MIRCLIIKTSSLGDIIHTLPALTDAVNALGDIRFDWVVEEAFSEIPAWHPAVDRVLPVAIRRWRKNLFKTWRSGEWRAFKQMLEQQQYDYVIDAQGLLKSAFISRYTRGTCYGLDQHSAREPLASRFYQHPIAVPKNQHAVERVRQLFSSVLGYRYREQVDYGIRKKITGSENKTLNNVPGVMFFHGTTWKTKHWPESYWEILAQQLINDGYHVFLPWGNESEKSRIQKIKQSVNNAERVTVLPEMTLTEIMHTLACVEAVVSVDTGLAHLAAALDKVQVTIFGPTDPKLTRPYGHNQCMLQVNYPCRACMKKICDKSAVVTDAQAIHPPCFTSLPPQKVYGQLNKLIGGIEQ